MTVEEAILELEEAGFVARTQPLNGVEHYIVGGFVSTIVDDNLSVIEDPFMIYYENGEWTLVTRPAAPRHFEEYQLDTLDEAVSLLLSLWKQGKYPPKRR